MPDKPAYRDAITAHEEWKCADTRAFEAAYIAMTWLQELKRLHGRLSPRQRAAFRRAAHVSSAELKEMLSRA